MEMKTVLISYLISNLICVGVVGALYWQNRGHFKGLGFWLADFVLQFAAVLLVALRGIVPDFIAMVVGNSFAIGGTILLYMGLEQFTGKRGTQWHNAILFILFLFVHSYFAIISPNLTARNINLAFALLVICAQSVWLLLCKVDIKLRSITRDVGIVFAAYCLVNAGRIIASVTTPSDENFFQSNLYDISAVMAYQMLFIALTFSLFLMVNRRLLMELQEDIAARQQTEEALRFSEEKFYKAFHSSPDLVAITRLRDGSFVEVNEAFSQVSGYSRKEMLNSSITTLDIWTTLQDREAFIQLLQTEGVVRAAEYKYRTKFGEVRTGLLSAEIIQLGNEPHIVSVIHDITERKEAEAALSASEAKYRLLYETMAQGIVYQDGQGKILSANSAAERILGLTLDQMQGRTSIDPRWRSIHEDGSDFPGDTHPAMVALREGRNVSNVVMGVFNPKNNEYRWININATPQFREGESAPYQVYTTFEDITERKQADEELRESKSLYESLVNQLPQNLYRIALDGKVLFINRAYQQNLGVPLEDILGKITYDLSPDDKALQYREEDAQVIASGKPLKLIDENISPVTGQISYNEGIKIPIFDKDGNVRGIQGVFYDITERKQAEEKLRASEERFRQLITSAPDVVFLVDQEGKIMFANLEATNLLGYTPDEFIGMGVEKLIPPQLHNGHIANRAKYMSSPRTRIMGAQMNLSAIHKDGNQVAVDIRLSPVQMEAETYIITFMRDATERVQAEIELRATHETLQTQFNEISMLKDALQKQAIHDPLTNLYNRRYLNEMLEHEVARATRENYPIGIMLIDIDRFKGFNDTYGHSAGDEMLKSLSHLLVDSIREGDVACRYGGEEFLVVMIGAHETDVKRRAEEICQNFSRLQIRFGEQELSATVSIGVAFYPMHSAEIQSVLNAADAAMYQAKQAGRNRVQVWQAGE